MLALLVLASAALAAPVTFHFDRKQLAGAEVKTVAVVGEFNGWNQTANLLTDPDNDGIYEATLDLAEGTYLYKFLVNGDRWLNDPTADESLSKDDGYGGKNSGILVGRDITKLPPPQPDHVDLSLVQFDPTDIADVNVVDKHTVRMRVRTQANDVQRVEVKHDGLAVPLTKLGTNRGFDEFGGIVTLPPQSPLQTLVFSIQLTDGSATELFKPQGSGDLTMSVSLTPTFLTPDWARDAVWYQIFLDRFRNGDPSNDPGDFPYENLLGWKTDWWKIHPEAGETPGEENFYKGTGNVWNRRYGGDLAGLRQSLPYLREVGINAIYLNPIFEADSMHKYDTTDYRHIDDNFGVRDPGVSENKAKLREEDEWRPRGNREFFELDGTPMPKDYVETEDLATWRWTKSDLLFLDVVAEAHRQGFHIILDGVFNHVGRPNPFFQDVVKNGAASKYASWFEVREYPATLPADPKQFGKPGGLRYNAWGEDSGALPVFHKSQSTGLVDGPRQHVLAVTTRWLAPGGDASKGVDGWRLDVPGDIPAPFWVEWRKAVKNAKPDAYTTAEIWTWAVPALKGDQFDAVMNYQFAIPTIEFFANKENVMKVSEFAKRLSALVFTYPMQVALVQQNLFDSHDTDRLASMFVNPDRGYDQANRIQDSGPNYSPRKPTEDEFKRMLQAYDLQMTFVGAPMIYYGNETGMWGPDDPSDRMPMTWRDLLPYENKEIEFNEEVFGHIRRLIAIREKFAALRRGAYVPIAADDQNNVLAFARELGEQKVYVVINRSNKATEFELPVTDGVAMRDYNDPAGSELIESQQPDGRPSLRPDGEASIKPEAGKVKLNLKPYSTAILAADGKQP